MSSKKIAKLYLFYGGRFMLGNVADKRVILNLRLSPKTRHDFAIAAELRGASMSGLIHQFIVRTIREERELSPQNFQGERKGNASQGIPVAPRSKTGGIRMKIENPKTEKVRRTKGGAN